VVAEDEMVEGGFPGVRGSSTLRPIREDSIRRTPLRQESRRMIELLVLAALDS
jgi:hypothetical protein